MYSNKMGCVHNAVSMVSGVGVISGCADEKNNIRMLRDRFEDI